MDLYVPSDPRQTRTLNQLDERLDRIALLPGVVAALVGLDPQSSLFADRVIALAQSDPPFALRLLRLANSAGIAGPDPVETIPAAILRVGAATFAQLVLALSVIEVFVPRTRGQRELWTHSLQVAVAARTIAHLAPELGVEPEQAYLAGLLHDIGRFVLFEHEPAQLGEIEEAHAATPRDLVDAEVRVCGFDHAELGWHVCRKWSLPDNVAALVRLHHVYHDRPSRIPPEVLTLTRVVQEADWLSFALLRDPRLAQMPAVDRRSAVAVALTVVPDDERPLAPAVLSDHVVEIDRESRKVAAAVGISVPSAS